ncbi:MULTISPECIES: hypothetical protein [Hydrogenophaga]|uniref:Uncharacterized protein n=1 Tax=Hydrogenophaga electricum TaxID=1230953 RepID=A0ABQ6BXW1_9BURK|nr:MULTISPECIES: hypothetical protein [Hydrogenophaga]GLS12782.1 hypothetical protein GCM10007935_02080 [Hydrogenophaga electricum]
MKPRATQVLVWLAVAAALAATLALYRQPDFMVNLADQLWSCF